MSWHANLIIIWVILSPERKITIPNYSIKIYVLLRIFCSQGVPALTFIIVIHSKICQNIFDCVYRKVV